MENTSHFLTACKSLGIPDIDLFQTADLVNGNMNQVLITLLSLKRQLQLAKSKTAPQQGSISNETLVKTRSQSSISSLLDSFKQSHPSQIVLEKTHLHPFVSFIFDS